MKTKLILDINKTQHAQLNSIVTGRVGDKASNTVDVYVVDGFIPYNLTGSDVYFECAKPDNTSVRDKNGITMIDAAKGHFEYTFPAQTFASVGKSKQAYFTVEKNSTVKATTQDFIIVSIPDALTNRIPSKTYISQLEELIWQLEQIQLDLLNSEAYREAHDAKTFAEQAKTLSESVKAQLDQIVIQGSIDPETKQARVDVNGDAKSTLKQRIDDDYLSIMAKLGDLIQLNVKDFGAKTDGSDNASAFSSLSQFINNSPNDNFEVFFPHGEYKYSDGLVFFKHVKLRGYAATLNYTGNGKALELGDRSLVLSKYQTQFVTDGLTFTGGRNMTHGIFVNRFVTKPKFLNTTFSNFGNATAYSLWLNGDNWDTMLFNFSWYSNTTYKQNFFKVNPQNLNSTRVRILGSVLTNQSVVRGMGVWLDGGYCEIAHSKIEGFSPNVRLGSLCVGTSISSVYFETVDNGACIVFGDDVGTPRESSYLQNITIKDVYCNLHSHDLGTIANFIAPANPLTGLQSAYIDTINLTGLKNDMEAIKLNNVGSQTNNSAKNFYGANIIRTIGNNISQWEGIDFTSTKGIVSKGQIATNVLSRFQNDMDSAGYLDVRAGKTAKQYSGFKISDFNGSDTFIIEVSPTNATNFKNSDGTFMSVTASRKVGFGKVPSNDTLEVNGSSSADAYYFNKAIDANTVRNGGLFIDTDGKLKFRDNTGTLKTIVTQ